ncbi:MAG: transglycosylase SLT domain-containing protein [Deltaproteobacteria bacterium]|nr:transglycosylase SLT domain-containing protein [Deltaproteobacteria bacterium]
MKKLLGYTKRFSVLSSILVAAIAGPAFTGVCLDGVVSAKIGGYARATYILPPDIQKQGLTFAQVKIPLDRREVAIRIVDQMNYLLMDRRAGMMEWFDRMAIYGPTIISILQDEKIPTDLFYVSVLMSDLTSNTRTKTGGLGWWALGSSKEKKNSSAVPWVSTNDWDDRRDPVLSTRIAINLLQNLLLKTADKDWLLAISAFADGSDKIDAIVRKAPGFSYWDMVMPPYSDVLIPRAVALKIIDAHRQFYGVDMPGLPPLAYDFMDRLKLVKDLPLHIVAKWCDTSPRNMWELNPGVDPSTGILPRPDTRSPSGFPLRVPKGKGNEVRRLLVRDGYLAE